MTHKSVTRESLTLGFYRVVKYFIRHVSDTGKKEKRLEPTRILLGGILTL